MGVLVLVGVLLGDGAGPLGAFGLILAAVISNVTDKLAAVNPLGVVVDVRPAARPIGFAAAAFAPGGRGIVVVVGVLPGLGIGKGVDGGGCYCTKLLPRGREVGAVAVAAGAVAGLVERGAKARDRVAVFGAEAGGLLGDIKKDGLAIDEGFVHPLWSSRRQIRLCTR